MALNSKQQAFEMVKKSVSPLILISENPEGDAISSALALFLILKKLNKNPYIACSKQIADKFLFLPGQQEIKHSISGERSYKISLNVGQNEIKELSYEQVGSVLNVNIITDSNTITKESLSMDPSGFKYDLIFVLSTPDLESLGKIYFDNTDLFFQSPIINIDNHPSNEYFGTINLVEVTSASVSEIINEFRNAVLGEKYDEDISTLLLAGIIAETNNFQSGAINPNTFSTAASLLAAGAKQEEIIKNFYKTKPLSVLKLIGQIVNNMSFDPEYSLAWTKLSKDDFEKTSSNPSEIDIAINELVNNSKDIDILLITYQNNEITIGNIWMDRMFDAKTLTRELNGEKKNHKIIIAEANSPITAFEEKILAKLKNFVKISQKRIGAIE